MVTVTDQPFIQWLKLFSTPDTVPGIGNIGLKKTEETVSTSRTEAKRRRRGHRPSQKNVKSTIIKTHGMYNGKRESWNDLILGHQRGNINAETPEVG